MPKRLTSASIPLLSFSWPLLVVTLGHAGIRTLRPARAVSIISLADILVLFYISPALCGYYLVRVTLLCTSPSPSVQKKGPKAPFSASGTMASLSTRAEDTMHGICEYLTLHDILQLTLTPKRFATSFERSLLLHRDLALQGYSAMMSAIINKNVGRVEELLKLSYDASFAWELQTLSCPADFDFPIDHLTLQAPSNVAIRHGTPGFLATERLYRPACDLHKIFISYSVLAHAILEDQIDIVKLLHKNGADFENLLLQVFTFRGTPVDVDHQISLLHLASSGAMIETLLELAPNIPIDKDRCFKIEPLLLCHIDRGTDIKGLRRLLEAGAHVDGARPTTQRIRFCQCQEDDTLHVFLDHQSPLEAAI
ncbi:hypothetical protein CSAL01_03022 [Colletotrichum salicis]|uniref:Uncharacterized protein n=1 Tax=Colletotrichum salicis TaxID=1209931 RepID=A0A135TE56_9PEZI|nr:hypothetical protein CSAL01_03022 [Colletotrichum salicis]